MPHINPQNPLFADLTAISAGVAGVAGGFRTSFNTQFSSVMDAAQSACAYEEYANVAAGNGWLSGGAISAGTGLTANIALGTAIIGTYTSWSAIVSPALTNSAVNYIFMRQDGTASANTTGTAPSGDGKGYAVLWGTATCAGGVVTAVNNIRAPYFPANKGWGVKDYIEDGETVIINDKYQQQIYDLLTVYGTQITIGKVRVV